MTYTFVGSSPYNSVYVYIPVSGFPVTLSPGLHTCRWFKNNTSWDYIRQWNKCQN